VRGELITGAAELEALVPAWDGLAVACGRPYAAPAWQLGWWRRAAPPGARPLVAVARDGATSPVCWRCSAVRAAQGSSACA
jgi:hypothetical protein